MQDECVCKICGLVAEGKKLSNHIKREHGLSSIEYTIRHIYGGERPKCLECGAETRYSAYSFKRYCREHSHIAESQGGRRGGRAPAWNKNLTKDDDERIRKQASDMSGSRNHFYGKRHTGESLQRMRSSRRLTRHEFEVRCAARSNELLMLTDYDEYHQRQGQYLDVQCLKCGMHMKRTLETFERGTACQKCFPTSTSKAERELAEFVESLGFAVERNVRDVIPPKELDVYVRDARFAIEHNGLYAHMQGGHFSSPTHDAHVMKTVACEGKDVRLFHLFSDEWRDKKALVKDMIRARLHLHERRLRASKLSVTEINAAAARTFFDKNHISGFTGAMKHFALINDANETIAAMSFRIPRHRRYADALEIARFASQSNTLVYGAAGRLIKRGIQLARDCCKSRIMTYADRRFGRGNVYTSIGFTLIGETAIDYWLTDGRNRYDRFKFRAAKGFTQREVEANAGVFRVYGCGSYIYTMNV